MAPRVWTRNRQMTIRQVPGLINADSDATNAKPEMMVQRIFTRLSRKLTDFRQPLSNGLPPRSLLIVTYVENVCLRSQRGYKK
jgi:hypothetical protein